MTPRLLRAFRATRYEAEGAVARIGRRSPAVDALLKRPAAFITAWNPCSRAMPFGWNDRMQDRLRQLVRGRVIGRAGTGPRLGGASPAGGRAARALRVIARRFRQHAIVIVAPGRAARLLLA